jgi:hypothetical protein
MIGLRLSDSALDEVPFATRVYCRKVSGAGGLANPLEDWRPIFRAVPATMEAMQQIATKIDDIEQLGKLLGEPDSPDCTWGRGLPPV